MTNLIPIRSFNKNSPYQKGDYLVMFGELFSRGYANGIIEEAKKEGLNVILSTVGRRENGVLRVLNQEETPTTNENTFFINTPLEAGFDQEVHIKEQLSPCDKLKGVKLSQWQDVNLDEKYLTETKQQAEQSFSERTLQFLKQVENIVPADKNILFVHSMAGGVPRAKIVMPCMNRVFKGTGDRFVPSKLFWESDIGKFCSMNFESVTANTFQLLLNESQFLRDRAFKNNKKINYVAYGYHGTEVLIDNKITWQTYTPYLQGWAKKKLEKIAQSYQSEVGTAQVFNCPEILTNSSSIFQGLEVSLYPLLGEIDKYAQKGNEKAKKIIDSCLSKLAKNNTVKEILDYTDNYMNADIIKTHSSLDDWPQHNSKEQMEFMLQSSNEMISWHKDPKVLSNIELSELIFEATGKLMFHHSNTPDLPVSWIGHDIMAKIICEH